MRLFFLILLIAGSLPAQKLSPAFQDYLNAHPGEEQKVWLFFGDKGSAAEKGRPFSENIRPRALSRRSRVNAAYDLFDLPVASSYKAIVSEITGRIERESRWLNAVSVWATPGQIEALNALAFIRRIRPVARRAPRPPLREQPLPAASPGLYKSGDLDYGSSFNQLEMLKIPEMHKKGFNGDGVIIGMLDDGFSHYKTHLAFQQLRVLATWDFVNDNREVDDPDAVLNKGYHGSKTLSTIGGFAPGYLIGPAYNATYLLAKTEIDSIEQPVEEDNWVAGLEWAEAMGADIVSSSLGYIDWYDWDDMDGQTAVTTLAANIAEQKGLIVVNAMGNEGNNADHGTLIAPADGFFVVSVGGVRPDGSYWTGASVGPTADNRIKPTVAAQAQFATVISTYNDSSFTQNNGTSFATPLVAGAIALLLQAHPSATPADIRMALQATSNRAGSPDKFTGYGIVNTPAALEWLNTNSNTAVDEFYVLQNAPNPFRDFSLIKVGLPVQSVVSMDIFNSLGQRVLSLPARTGEGQLSFLILGTQLPAGGIYFYRIKARVPETKRLHMFHGRMIFLR